MKNFPATYDSTFDVHLGFNECEVKQSMNLKVQLLWAFIISVGSLIGFSMMALAISTQNIMTFDQTIISFVQGLETQGITSVMKFFTFIGDTQAVIVISLLFLLFLYKVLKNRSELILFIVVVSGTPILNGLLKNFFQRARPELNRLIEIGGYSFPSGHAMNALTVYGIISFLLWRHIPTQIGRTMLIVISSVFILMIGLSRIYLGVHYPSDIIAGYFAGGFWLSSVIWFFQRYKEKRYERKSLSRRYV